MSAQPLTPPPSIPVTELSPDLLARARARAGRGSVMQALIDLSGASPEDMRDRVASRLGVPALRSADLNSLAMNLGSIRFSEALSRSVAVAEDAGGGRIAVVADPYDLALQDWLAAALHDRFELCLATRDDITAALARFEDSQRASAGLLDENAQAGSSAAEVLSLARIADDSSPVVRVVNSTLYDALKQGASDIHLESVPAGMQVKYRVDGVMVRIGQIAGADTAEQVISRIKVLAELDIAERRVPQDGRFKVAYAGRDIDLRVSVMPSVHGEDAVLRVLDKEHLTEELQALTLESLGFDDIARAAMRKLAAEPYGMLLVTGPTGSGKTTSLYATIGEINHGLDKIITIEDPVEYQLPGVLQIPVNEKKGLTFARGLRSVLRHDPDKIMVGEIRDGETAEIAVQAALTGHLVLTTVHANNVFDVIGRFLHMGVDPYNLVSALNGIVAQRLLRLNCRHCAVPQVPDAALLEESGLAGLIGAGGYDFRAGTGCGHCRGTGYKGRRAIAELLVLDDELRELIVTRAPMRQLKEAARARGTRTLREAGLALVANGETSLAELNRVTFVV
ncbi:General secretion pathway protein E [Methyloversatilis universalis FAM5]|uniref:General secretion pathway protein E n=1 Tax=Methyloversatilis universalis (strain ATCC BAA-1314 / DSM 25237 / JCM 13912 / CCUG 52030 / FAM5) TaxID=1000565 RepID=F5R9B4_METUF|nr:GspE/PulE family protein [Methyloversatilis universalis]EGK72905.1 General secretion pathway protein E [Methyloversatilis universalis FAM5]